TLAAVVTQVAPDTKLTAVGGRSATLAEWTTTFQMLTVVLDPYTQQSAWLLETAGRFLENFTGADARVSWIVTADEADTKRFLGPWAEKFLTYADPDREFVKAVGLEKLPALVYIRQDLAIIGQAEGWDPQEWENLGKLVAKVTSWNFPKLPAAGDPGPFEGSPAKG
ncbi:MAG: hypothetical protein KDA95_12155, partial [Acidimicrobiales bacterium]|nr:hypothetical protein [Acidimicrobiales bacterium]